MFLKWPVRPRVRAFESLMQNNIAANLARYTDRHPTDMDRCRSWTGPEKSDRSVGRAFGVTPVHRRKFYLHLSAVRVDRSGRSGVNFNPARPRAGIGRRGAIKQAAEAPARARARSQAFGRHITGQMSDDRTLAEAYISRPPVASASATVGRPARQDSSHFRRDRPSTTSAVQLSLRRRSLSGSIASHVRRNVSADLRTPAARPTGRDSSASFDSDVKLFDERTARRRAGLHGSPAAATCRFLTRSAGNA